jgi:hypothetical protein
MTRISGKMYSMIDETCEEFGDICNTKTRVKRKESMKSLTDISMFESNSTSQISLEWKISSTLGTESQATTVASYTEKIPSRSSSKTGSGKSSPESKNLL